MSAPPPSPEQIAQMRAQFEAEAAKRGMTPAQFQAFQQQEIMKEAAKHNVTPQQYIQMMQAKAMAEHQRQQQAQAQQGQQGQGQGPRPGQQVQQQIPLNGSVEAKPEALALAKFLRKEDLKTRTCILEGIRRDMFRGTSESNLIEMKLS
jgi:translocation protein SEC62